jgi:hypothetical protein
LFAACNTLLWCILLLSLIIYFFAVCFLTGVTDYIRDSTGNAEEKATVVRLYGTVSRACVTLFMCISGGTDWQDAMVPLVNIHWAYKPIFMCFIFFMFFGVLNVVVGSFVTAATEVAQKDKELIVNAELRAKEEYKKKVSEFFADADKTGVGTLSWADFKEHMKNPSVSAYFASLELDVSNAHRLFRLLDADCSNEVGIDEFLDGCTRLKGQARSIDVNMLIHEIERMSRQISFLIEASHNSKLWTSENVEAHQILPQ